MTAPTGSMATPALAICPTAPSPSHGAVPDVDQDDLRAVAQQVGRLRPRR